MIDSALHVTVIQGNDNKGCNGYLLLWSCPVLALIVSAMCSEKSSTRAQFSPAVEWRLPAIIQRGSSFHHSRPGFVQNETLNVRGQGGGEETKSNHIKTVLKVTGVSKVSNLHFQNWLSLFRLKEGWAISVLVRYLNSFVELSDRCFQLQSFVLFS